MSPRVNLTFIFADVTLALAIDGKGNIGLQFTAAFGLSLSTGISLGATVTDANCINELEGIGSSAGTAFSIPGILLGAGFEVNEVWPGWGGDRRRTDGYKGIDIGAGLSIGVPLTPQIFTGVTGTLARVRYN